MRTADRDPLQTTVRPIFQTWAHAHPLDTISTGRWKRIFINNFRHRHFNAEGSYQPNPLPSFTPPPPQKKKKKERKRKKEKQTKKEKKRKKEGQKADKTTPLQPIVLQVVNVVIVALETALI